MNGISSNQSREPLRWLQASSGRNIEFTDVSAVTFFRAEDKYTTVALVGRELIIRTSLKELLPQLDPARFWQIHRSTIVNVAFIDRAVHEDGELYLLIKGRDEKLSVSRAWRHRFKQL
jgi:DNA-binding LytR/AlgR family response regulator